MEQRKKRWKCNVGILLTLVMLCGILLGGRGGLRIAAEEGGNTNTGDGAQDGQPYAKVKVANHYSGETRYVESLEEAFAYIGEVGGNSGEVSITLLADVELQNCINVNGRGVTYLQLNGHTVLSKGGYNAAAFEVASGSGTFSVQGEGAIYAEGMAFRVTGDELSLGDDVYIYVQGDTGIQVTGGHVKLLGGCVSAGKTALEVQEFGNVRFEAGALRVVSGSAIDAGGKSGDGLLASFLSLGGHYSDENGGKIVLGEEQKSIAGYCSVGGVRFAPKVTVELQEPAPVYDGKAKKPLVEVLVQGIPIDAGYYHVDYSENVNAGTARVSGFCNGIFAPAAVEGTFPIMPAVPRLTWGQEEAPKVYDKQPVMLSQEPVIELVNGESFAEKFSGAVRYSYRKEGEEAYTPGLPTYAGTYQVKASLAAEGNYAEGETETELRLVVNKAPIPHPAPSDTMQVAYSHSTLAGVELPDGWKWQDTAVLLKVNTPVAGMAVYDGEDKGNYETETVQVMVTRQAAEAGGLPGTPGKDPEENPGGPVPTLNPTPQPTDGAGSPTPKPEPTDEAGSPTPQPTDGAGSPTPKPEPTDEADSPVQSPTPAVKDPDGKEEGSGGPERGEPFIRTDEDGNIKQGWNAVIEEADRVGDGGSIIVDMNGAGVVPEDVLDCIRDRDVTIVLDLGNGISWSIHGEDITADRLGDIDFSVQTGTNTIPVDVINTITGERYTIQVSLAYDGEFGLTATLTVELGSENAGYNASLYYYNPETGALEFITVVEIQEDGTASWKFTHASDYVIVVWEEKEGGPTAGQGTSGTELPDTGMAWKGFWFLLAGAVLIFAGFGMMYFGSRRKNGIRNR